MEPSDKSNGQIEKELKDLNVKVDKLTSRIDDLSSRVDKLEGKKTDAETTEKPYDADPMLNEVLNKANIYEKLNEIEKKYSARELRIYNFLIWMVSVILVAMFGVPWLVKNWISENIALIIYILIILLVLVIIYFKIKSKKETQLGSEILSCNSEIITALKENEEKYNFKYLTYLLKHRVEEKRTQNKIFKTSVMIAGSISGIGIFYTRLGKGIIGLENGMLKNNFFAFTGLIMIIFIIVLVFLKLSALGIDGEGSIFKWERLADDVNLIKSELETAEDDKNQQGQTGKSSNDDVQD